MLQYCSVIVYLGVSVEFEMTEELIFMSSLHETTQLQRKYFQISWENTDSVQPEAESAKTCYS